MRLEEKRRCASFAPYSSHPAESYLGLRESHPNQLLTEKENLPAVKSAKQAKLSAETRCSPDKIRPEAILGRGHL